MGLICNIYADFWVEYNKRTVSHYLLLQTKYVFFFLINSKANLKLAWLKRPFQKRAWSCVTSYYSPLRGSHCHTLDTVNPTMGMMLCSSMLASEKVYNIDKLNKGSSLEWCSRGGGEGKGKGKVIPHSLAPWFYAYAGCITESFHLVPCFSYIKFQGSKPRSMLISSVRVECPIRQHYLIQQHNANLGNVKSKTIPQCIMIIQIIHFLFFSFEHFNAQNWQTRNVYTHLKICIIIEVLGFVCTMAIHCKRIKKTGQVQLLFKNLSAGSIFFHMKILKYCIK